MAPYLQTVKSFADVQQTDAGIDTVGFIEASKGLVGIFTLLNSSAFTLVTKDLTGNIAKVQARYDADPAKAATLEELVKNEIAEKKTTATQGLLWLNRGLSFTCKALQQTQANKNTELAEAFNASYEKTLKPHHNFVIRPLFYAAMKACPKRETLYAKLASNSSSDTASVAWTDALDPDLNRWLAALDESVTKLDAFFAKNNYVKEYKL